MLRPLSPLVINRLLHSSPPRLALFDPKSVDRAEDDVDVCIVGGGPAGISAAIRLKQLQRDRGGPEIRVVVLEKGSEAGAHIVSGAVLEPRALNELLPDWNQIPDHPLTTPATSSSMRFFTQKYTFPIPHPPQMNNKGNYIVSLSGFTRWLASVAENEYGVEIYPGFAGAQLLHSKEKDSLDPWGAPAQSVRGIITNEVGLTRGFVPKPSFEPGMKFNAKVTLLAEGAHGSLSKLAIAKYNLRKESQPQTYGIGVKEVWRVDPAKHEPGKVVHTMGWPMDYKTYGGGFVYHMGNGLVSLGLVVGLDYQNPYLSPYRELQRMKHHPYYRDLLAGAERLTYGARTLTEGGLQSLPRLHFPGGALIGCSAGFMNVAKIKGTHNAMKSGMIAAEAAFDAVAEQTEGEGETRAADMSAYETNLRDSWVWDDLKEVRNIRPSFNTPLGMWGGIAYSGVDSLLLRGRVPWTFNHAGKKELKGLKPGQSLDASHTQPASQHKPIDYPPFEAPLSTDLMTSVALTGTNHAEDQPIHLRVVETRTFAREVDEGVNERAETGEVVDLGLEEGEKGEVVDRAEIRRKHVRENVERYAGLLGRACPAGVYEYVNEEGQGKEGETKLVINSQNCIHCKLCDVKVPTQDITWTVPEGGGGPKYSLT